MKNLWIILAILALLFEIYRLVRGYWIRRILEKKKKKETAPKTTGNAVKKRTRLPDLPKGAGKTVINETRNARFIAWRKDRGVSKKKISTEGYFCPNVGCEYYGITDEETHALVGDGEHGKWEAIQDLKCEACGKKFTIRKNTVLYRLKTVSGLVEKILWLLALGVEASALEEVFGVREITIRTWLCRSGMQGRKLHERFLVKLDLIHVQLDELWTNVEYGSQDLWLWVALLHELRE